jgi:protein-S-isoprenylcysteine O-methyltransferase Ste14
VQNFLESHAVASVLLAAAVGAGAAVEWIVTVRERVRSRKLLSRDRSSADRGTKYVLIGSIVVGASIAWNASRRLPGLRLPGSGWIWFTLGLALVVAGFGLRVWAIVVLGRFFSRVVVIQEDHEVVRNGPYRFIRHPAYTGNLLFLLGIGFALVNWVALAALAVVPLLGHLPRIRVEERALERSLGEPYRAYEAVTKRLVPGVW